MKLCGAVLAQWQTANILSCTIPLTHLSRLIIWNGRSRSEVHQMRSPSLIRLATILPPVTGKFPVQTLLFLSAIANRQPAQSSSATIDRPRVNYVYVYHGSCRRTVLPQRVGQRLYGQPPARETFKRLNIVSADRRIIGTPGAVNIIRGARSGHG